MKMWLVLVLGFMVLDLGRSEAGVLPFINEIHYDNAGVDVNEAVEIAGLAGESLSGWKFYLYDGSSKSYYDQLSLTGVFPNQQNDFGVLSFITLGIQNGPADGLALVSPLNTVTQFLSYEGSFTAANGPAKNMISTDIGVSESSSPLGYSLQIVGRGRSYEDFSWRQASVGSFGQPNSGQTFVVTQAEVPELDSKALLLIGTCGMALLARKRN